jgi:uncharacterized protein (TIGR03067 family)
MRELPLTKKDKEAMFLVLSNKKFQGFLGEGTCKLDESKLPRRLDLIYTKGDVLGTRRCIFEIEGNKLKIAYSLPYLPGTPEQELERAKKMFATRPKSFVPGPEESTLVLIFERKKM